MQKRRLGNSNSEHPANPSKRSLLKVTAAGLIGGFGTPLLFVRSSSFAQEKRAGNVLIAYFSRTGNTREFANQIHRKVGHDLLEIKTLHSYPEDYGATTEQAKQEQATNFRPQLSIDITSVDLYGRVFIGYPIWWGTLPMALFAFLEKFRFDGSTLIPFCTHEGSGLGRSVSHIRALCPNSTILEGLALRGGKSGHIKTERAQRDIAQWLESLRI